MLKKEDSSSEESDVKVGSSDGTSGFSGDNLPLQSERVDFFNKGLSFLGSSPIKKQKLSSKRYLEEKSKQISSVIDKKIFNLSRDDPDNLEADDDESSIISALQESFNTSADRVHKIKILTIFRSWSYKKIEDTFPSATRHMIGIAKNIARDKGLIGDPNPKQHPSLDENVIDTIVSLYQSDDYTQCMPGKKDYVSIKVDGKSIPIQKRLVLNNLKELYEIFTSTYPTMKCSFSKFASLRPKYCVLAGASGTHSVCVCPIHENVSLLVSGANFKSLTSGSEMPLINYKDCLDRMVCKNKTTDCYLNSCKKCPGVTNVIEQLEEIFEEKCIEIVTYKQWVTVERTSLQTLISPVDEFLQKLSEGLQKLLIH